MYQKGKKLRNKNKDILIQDLIQSLENQQPSEVPRVPRDVKTFIYKALSTTTCFTECYLHSHWFQNSSLYYQILKPN